MSNLRREIFRWRFGEDPCSYTLLSEPELSSELARLSHARKVGNTDCVSFQPNALPENWNQDRFAVHEFSLMDDDNDDPQYMWKLRAVFDGHLGHDTVDHAVQHLPKLIQARLKASTDLSSDSVTLILSETIKAYDGSLSDDLLSLLPPESRLHNLSDEEARNLVNDHAAGGQNLAKVLRCMQGSTVIIALTSPGNEDLWVASLGDSYVALGLQDKQGQWESISVSSYHNGQNVQEREHVMREHPNETGVLFRNRVFGALAVTRGLGDHLYKLPQVYTDRIFMNADPGWSRGEKNFVKTFIKQNLTPPYISNIPEIHYTHLDSKRLLNRTLCLLMCSDGLGDLYQEYEDSSDSDSDDVAVLSRRWLEVVTKHIDSTGVEGRRVEDNVALSLLRDALGGLDEEKVSSMMTAELYEKWMDDTTILFEFL